MECAIPRPTLENPIPAMCCPSAIPSRPSFLLSTASRRDLEIISIAFQMEHICHFPYSFGLYIPRSHVSGHPYRWKLSVLWHGEHHIRIHDCNDRHIMWIDTDEFSLSLHICDNIIDRNLCSIPAVVGTAMIRYAWFFRGCNSSRLLTSSNSGLAIMIPIAFEVSIEDPPPIAIR